jgi:hypothetical protein
LQRNRHAVGASHACRHFMPVRLGASITAIIVNATQFTRVYVPTNTFYRTSDVDMHG